jgi:hypothetical protein
LHQQALFAKDDLCASYMHPFDWNAYDENPQGKGNLNTKLSKMRLDISRLIGGSNIAYVEEGKTEAFNDS